MALDSYSALKATVADWLHRTNLTSQIVDFVRLAETRINDALVLRGMETEFTLTGTQGDDYIALPSGFMRPIAMWIVIDGIRTELIAAMPQEYAGSNTQSIPRYYAIDGQNVQFDCPLSDAYSFALRYIKSSFLSDSNPTNYLLESRPDLYLAGAMVEAGRYTQDAEMMTSWEQKFQQAIIAVKTADSRSRSNVSLRTDVGASARSNIFEGE